MEKVYGTTERHDSLIMYRKTGKAVLVFGYGKEDGQGYDYRHTFNKLPTKEEVLTVIIDHVNSISDERILSGFVWHDKKIWLSTENQFNFKAAYDLTVQTGGATLPVKFKIWENDDKTPVYYTFETVEEFAECYTQALAYIIDVLNEGWIEKDRAKQWLDTIMQ